MKNSFLILITAILFSSACQNKSDKKSLIGKWKPVEVNIPEASYEEKKGIIDDVVVEFTGDGRLINSGKGDTLRGTYNFIEKDSTLTANMPASPDMQVQQFKIEWRDDTMLMKNGEGEIKFKRQ
ncbi:MAG: hypothetical protein HZB42_07630 [Sphingobacteriales bacterium]|nr:hypothetical protein [Sphingobacteriales bacterium]